MVALSFPSSPLACIPVLIKMGRNWNGKIFLGCFFKSADKRKRSALKKRRGIHNFWQSKPAARTAVVISQHLRNEDYWLLGASCKRLLLYCCWFAFSSSVACPSTGLAGPLRAVVSWQCALSTTQKNMAPNGRAFPRPQCLSPNHRPLYHLRWRTAAVVWCGGFALFQASSY